MPQKSCDNSLAQGLSRGISEYVEHPVPLKSVERLALLAPWLDPPAEPLRSELGYSCPCPCQKECCKLPTVPISSTHVIQTVLDMGMGMNVTAQDDSRAPTFHMGIRI